MEFQTHLFASTMNLNMCFICVRGERKRERGGDKDTRLTDTERQIEIQTEADSRIVSDRLINKQINERTETKIDREAK